MDLGGHRDRNASHGTVKQNWERGTLPAFKGGRGKSPQIEFLSERNFFQAPSFSAAQPSALD